MGKTKTSGKGRLDKFYYLAKEQGYRSRAAFKLVQLNRKYQFLEKSRALLDLCAAPGGWLQVAAKYMPVSSVIIGVDLVPIRAIRGCTTLTQDITTPACRAEIKKLLKGSLVDVVLHDGSPNVGGAWSSEALGQAALSLESLKLATEFLRPGGMFVSKVFRSQDYNSLLFAFKQLFTRVEATKPVASRATSAEIYVVCQGYKAPGKIDPRLLDMRHIFQMVPQQPKVVDVLGDSKRKRFREGYEEGQSVVHKTSSASEFVQGNTPVEFLGTYHEIKFDTPLCKRILAHSATDAEVKTLCSDLQVLGKREFKHLLKWRMAVRKDLPSLLSEGNAEGEDEEVSGEGGAVPPLVKAGGEEEDEADGKEGAEGAEEEQREQVIMEEMEELKAFYEAKDKRLKKAQKKRKEKAKARQATGVNIDALTEPYGDEDLFSLVTIKSKQQLGKVGEADAPEPVEDMGGEDDDDDEIEDEDEDMRKGGVGGDEDEDDDDDEDSDAERRRYDEEVEAYLDAAYDRFCKAKEGSTKRRERARLSSMDEEEGGDEKGDKDEVGSGNEEDEEEDEEVEEEEDDVAEEEDVEDGEVVVEEGSHKDMEEEDKDENPLVVSEGKLVGRRKESESARKQRVAAQWFSQDVFQGLELNSDVASGGKGNVKGGKGVERKGKKGSLTEGNGPLVLGGVEGSEDEEVVNVPGEEGGKVVEPEGARKDTTKNKRKKKGGSVEEETGNKSVTQAEVGVKRESEGVQQQQATGAQRSKRSAAAAVAAETAAAPATTAARGSKAAAAAAACAVAPVQDKAVEDDDGGFEVVPADDSFSQPSSDDDSLSSNDSDDDAGTNGHRRRRSEFDDEDYDTDDKAETLAYAKRMLRKRQREEIVDEAFNRYAFDDDVKALPRWFVDDERRHMRAIQPITKEEVEAIKSQFRAIDARPVKKVAEAKARKRRRLMKQMEAVKAKASAIADQPDLNQRAKARQMERLYSRAAAKGKKDGKKEVVVAKKGSKGNRGRAAKGKIMVDKRMKADKRGEERSMKRSKGAGKGKGGRKGGGKGKAAGGGKGKAGGGHKGRAGKR